MSKYILQKLRLKSIFFVKEIKMNPIKYIKKNGVRHLIYVIYTYKLEYLLESIVFILQNTKN